MSFTPVPVLCCCTMLLFSSPLAMGHRSRIEVEEGIYSRVTVRIEEAVPKHLCFRTLDKLEELMSGASRGFHALTDGRSFLGDITVVLPESWSGTECANDKISAVPSAAVPSAASTDILVTSSVHPIFGSRPWTAQYGQCGVQGRRLQLPYTGLVNNATTTLPETEFLKEWLKLRFGIFEENGFEGDNRYPATFMEGEVEMPNRGCNGSEVICPADKYDSDVTTKQNILCDGRSAHKVIQASTTDLLFKNKNNSSRFLNDSLTFRPPVFSYTLPGPKLFVLVLDRSSSSVSSDKDSNNWEVLQQALLLGFVAKLPIGAQLSIITYGGKEASAAVNLPPTVITDKNREGLHGRIPRRPLTAGESAADPCLDCAMAMVFKAVDESNTKDARVVVAARSAVTAKVSANVSDEVEQRALPVFTVILSSEDGSKKSDLKSLSRFGELFVIPHAANAPDFLSQLSQSLTSVLREVADLNLVSFHRDERVPDPDNAISGNFVVEESLRNNVWVVLTVEDERDLESFEVLSPTGKRHSFPSFERRLAYFRLQGLNEPGIWSYTAKLYHTISSSSHYPVHVEVLGEPNDAAEKVISMEVWTEERKKGDRTEVFFYASVMQGSLPVSDALVVATVSRPGGLESVEMVMKDSGSGYPDVTGGDGIYSSYFSDLAPESGYYQLTVSAGHNGGAAKIPKASSEHECCSSQLPISYTVPTGPFQRFVTGPSFHIEQAANFYLRQQQQQQPQLLVNDVFPPSRVTDFKVDNYMENSLFVTLRWTAPGGDYDKGKAFKYEIRCYTSREALRDENFAEMSIPVHASLIPEPEMSGREQRCTVGVPWPNEVFHYALVAFDEAGNRGLISNTVSVFIREEPSTLAPMHDVTRNEIEEQPLLLANEDNSHQITYIAVGIVSLILVVLIILSAVAVRRHYRILTGLLLKKSDVESSGDGSLPEKQQEVWSTSDYSSQKSLCYKQQATSQEVPGVHKLMARLQEDSHYNNNSKPECESRAATHSTDCSMYEASDCSNSSGAQQTPDSPDSCKLAPRISVLEDFSVYRDLSNLSLKNTDYFSFSQLPAELQRSNVITVPPYYDFGTVDSKKRHESLV